MIIGFSGFAQVGKDSAAEPLIEEGFESLSFAAGVRRLAYELNQFVVVRDKSMGMNSIAKYRSVLDEHGYEWAKQHTSARQLLVDIGSGVRNVIGPDAWIAPVRATIENASPGSDFVITDVRYANEAAMIREFGGHIVRVIRPGVKAVSMEEERSLKQFHPDFVVYNDGGFVKLWDSVCDIASELREH